jgi:hypothetical protein
MQALAEYEHLFKNITWTPLIESSHVEGNISETHEFPPPAIPPKTLIFEEERPTDAIIGNNWGLDAMQWRFCWTNQAHDNHFSKIIH